MLQKYLGIGGVVIAVIALVAGVSFARKSQELKKQVEELKANPQAAAQDEVKQLVEKVGAIIALPEGETPTVATIQDKEKLKDVPFFTKAENDDKVLIYVNARKAYLYRPSSQKLIEVATINLSPNSAAQTLEGKIALRNGTDSAGLTKRVEDSLKQTMPKITVVERGDAKNQSTKETIVVDITGSRQADAERLAASLRGKVAALPEGEPKPSGVDFLVILGQDIATRAAASPSPTAAPSPSPKP